MTGLKKKYAPGAGGRPARYLRRMAAFCLELLFPRICPLCGAIVPRGQGLICPDCILLAEKALLRGPLCKKCGRPLTDARQEYCHICTAHPMSFQWGLSLFSYQNEVIRQSILNFKYHNKQEFADYYVWKLFCRHGSRLRAVCADAVVPVPLHKKKQRWRGYNQAGLLARKTAETLGVPVYPNGLVRVHNTSPQKTVRGRQRSQNLSHAFCVGRLPSGLHTVLLVDDIYTTGATMDACAAVLRRYGVRNVICVSICMSGTD